MLITGAAGGVGFLGGDATGYGGLVLGLLFSTLIATAVALFYAPFYMARTNGQTLGKQLMGIRVIRADGKPVDFLWSVWREVVVKAFLFAGLGSSITFGLAWLARLPLAAVGRREPRAPRPHRELAGREGLGALPRRPARRRGRPSR